VGGVRADEGGHDKGTAAARALQPSPQFLNVDLRPVTAKWHRAYTRGALRSRDRADELPSGSPAKITIMGITMIADVTQSLHCESR
jgi:hypothetical protein